MRRFCLGLLIGITSLTVSTAQDFSDDLGGAYGYTSVIYDPSTGTLTVYAETDADGYNYDYYSPGLEMYMNDNNGYVLNSSDPRCSQDTDGASYASVSCSIQAKANDNYTAVTNHWLSTYVVDYVEGGNYYYDDAYGFSTFAPLNSESPFGQVYAPPFIFYNVKYQNQNLGRTTDSASTAKPAVCGDARDQIIKEYFSYKSTFHPVCSDVSWINSWPDTGNFAFLTLTPTQDTGYGQFAILQSYMANNLRSVFNKLGNSPSITSGYRNPHHEFCCAGHYYPDSRHMAGDAIDLGTNGARNTYVNQAAAAHQATGCVEPVDSLHGPQTDYNHTHIDWRTLGSGNFSGPKSCPRNW